MGTKNIANHKKKLQKRPAVVAIKLRKIALYIALGSFAFLSLTLGLVIADVWVPGRAWLQ